MLALVSDSKPESEDGTAEAVTESKPEATSKSVVTIENYSFFYGENQVVFDVDLEVPEREIVALIGPSGCGKSTLLRNINRMNDLIPGCRHLGDIRIREQSIYDPRIDVIGLRRRIGMVFQKSNPFPKTIFENVVFGLRIAGERNRRTLEEAAERCLRGAALWDEVKDRLDDSALGLSGGQMQRLCIARALAVQPEILLMDEPCSALDPMSTARIEELLHELKKDYTIVIVTHNMQQASRVSDQTAFLYTGKLIEYDKTENIFSRPREQQTEDYISGRFG